MSNKEDEMYLYFLDKYAVSSWEDYKKPSEPVSDFMRMHNLREQFEAYGEI